MERVVPPRGRVQVPAAVLRPLRPLRLCLGACRAAAVLATSFVFFTCVLRAWGPASGRVTLRTDAQLRSILLEHAHGLSTAAETLRDRRPPQIQQHWHQDVSRGDAPHADLFELLADLTSQICAKLTTPAAILGRGSGPADVTELAVFDAELAATGGAERRLVDSCHLVLKPLWLAALEHKRLAWELGPAGRIHKLAVQGLEGLARELARLELAGGVGHGRAGAARQRTRSVEALSRHLVHGNAGQMSGPWPLSLNMSKSVVSNLLRHASSASDAAEEHLWPLVDGAIAALGRGESLMESSAAARRQAGWSRLLYGGAAPQPPCDASQLSRVRSELATDVFVARQLFRGVVGPLIGRATEVSAVLLDVETSIAALAARLSLLESHGWVTSPARATGLDGGSATLLTYWDMPSAGSVKAAVDYAIDEMYRHEGLVL